MYLIDAINYEPSADYKKTILSSVLESSNFGASIRLFYQYFCSVNPAKMRVWVQGFKIKHTYSYLDLVINHEGKRSLCTYLQQIGKAR